MESLSKVNLALLDKTGTLTSGKPRIGSMTLARGRRRDTAIALAAGLEASSNHPYAQAIIAYADNESVEPSTLTDITDIENGVSAKFKGSEVAFVRAELSQVSGKLEEELQFA